MQSQNVRSVMPQTIIAGNWKMNKTCPEAVELVRKIKEGLGRSQNRESPDSTGLRCVNPMVIVCPPFTVLSDIKKALENSVIKLGAQNMFWEKKGAYTGEVSAEMLVSAGCEFVILGHSERRMHFGEKDSDINLKIKAAISAGLRPIVCCGERLEEREKGEAEAVVEKQVKGGFKEIKGEDLLKCVIAYEPVWAIGTGKTATPQQAQDMHKFIRGVLSKLYSHEISSSISIIYGGSVKPDNIKELMQADDINGALVGGASLDADSFLGLLRNDM